jgi:hypothetical protein
VDGRSLNFSKNSSPLTASWREKDSKTAKTVLIIIHINFMQSSTKMILKFLCIFYSNIAHSSKLLPCALSRMTDAICCNFVSETNGRITRRTSADFDGRLEKFVWGKMSRNIQCISPLRLSYRARFRNILASHLKLKLD